MLAKQLDLTLCQVLTLHCTDQLSLVFTDIFSTSVEICHVLVRFIIPVLKNREVHRTHLNICSHLKMVSDPLIDPLQFAYRSIDNAMNLTLYLILKNMESIGNCL